MGRVHHLMRTLPINLHVAPDCEFVLLNYGSKDGMHEWVRDNIRPWVERGTVKYYRTQLPEYFVATHAKNIAHRQATGDILCNLDADNFLIDGFVQLIQQVMQNKDQIMTAPIFDMFNMSGSCGKIAVRREHFYSVNGYNEDMNVGWGWDDIDFEFRVAMHNKLKYTETPIRFCRAIDHNEKDRARNFRNKNIKETQRINAEILDNVKTTRNYVANKNREWGIALDLSSDI
jgi:predicted glycosyltransferase involved in capsule biosynthesis